MALINPWQASRRLPSSSDIETFIALVLDIGGFTDGFRCMEVIPFVVALRFRPVFQGLTYLAVNGPWPRQLHCMSGVNREQALFVLAHNLIVRYRNWVSTSVQVGLAAAGTGGTWTGYRAPGLFPCCAGRCVAIASKAFMTARAGGP